MATPTKVRFKSKINHDYKKEILFVLLSAFFIFVSISIFSYNSADNTLFHFSNQNDKILNLAGIVGANFAAFFFYFLGSATYFFLLCLGLTLYLLFSSKTLADARPRFLWLTIFLTATTTLFGITNIEVRSSFSGGLCGKILTNTFYLIAGMKGSIVILLALVWISTASFLQLPIFPFLNSGIKKLGFVLAPYVKSIFKFKASNLLNWCKFKDENDKIIPASELSKDVANDIEYWKSVLERPKASTATQLDAQLESQQKIAVSQTHEMFETFSKFENKTLRHETEKISCGKFTFVHLPNTVLTQNIFSKNASEVSVYENIVKNDIKEQPQSKTVEFVLPDPDIFAIKQSNENLAELKKEASECGKKLEEKLTCFGVKGKVVSVKPGPVITMYEYKPEIDSKISKITAVEDDLAMALTAKSIRILAPIPGKNVVGFEISNKTRQDVYFSDAIPSTGFSHCTQKLPLLMGVDVIGKPVIDDLSKMPHLLVGGATGSGKSVGLHSMIISLLCHLAPDKLKLVLIDPKRLEFGAYAEIPHLLFPIITSAETAITSLKWVVQEMEQRYIKMAAAGVRNINEYHDKLKTDKTLTTMTFIVVVIDELADLMMVGGKDLELQIVRIAQMARAAGIHMIVATQRPSVEVVTGLIKVNFPSRISFRVSSKIDSRTILDSSGAEKLLGRGDMLYMNSSSPDLLRTHGVYVSDQEIKKVADWWKNQQNPTYLNLHEELKVATAERATDPDDEIYDQVIEFIQNNDEVSISLLQRYFRIGFNRSARLIEKLEIDGLISPAQTGSKTRKVLR
ncbi:MAG: Cell division protein FtsK/SpoIIIE [candidate division TM6 bacterium GW2011_GWF2_37_49]|nr:MAG: Cell division protein FtsK/SpoIIIE [candidate division TM6 bacterium GW2011_GWF2_37_49]